ncbi:unnamed protein product [Vitrella brassicaformis CCMP3155]|uniref:Uncharacterized protein n=1 Tax=Vitrella brassicaformis (strain CCMP3155) TaxID=1169540 RepID=A0A0G4GUH8_VITBC|nr:unnamed protein product [Vitrella brassicaformis CCMP3155]|eukprot:CEM34492.1 unnamed protein product [Vitrella brassicaformis CCMP3155]
MVIMGNGSSSSSSSNSNGNSNTNTTSSPAPDTSSEPPMLLSLPEDVLYSILITCLTPTELTDALLAVSPSLSRTISHWVLGDLPRVCKWRERFDEKVQTLTQFQGEVRVLRDSLRDAINVMETTKQQLRGSQSTMNQTREVMARRRGLLSERQSLSEQALEDFKESKPYSCPTSSAARPSAAHNPSSSASSSSASSSGNDASAADEESCLLESALGPTSTQRCCIAMLSIEDFRSTAVELRDVATQVHQYGAEVQRLATDMEAAVSAVQSLCEQLDPKSADLMTQCKDIREEAEKLHAEEKLASVALKSPVVDPVRLLQARVLVASRGAKKQKQTA